MPDEQTSKVNPELKHAIEAILTDRPIAYHASLARVLKSVTAGVLLSQFLYWTPRSRAQGGWIWKTQADISEETALTRTEQETARKVCKKWGVLEERLAGVPAKLYFRVNTDRLSELLDDFSKGAAAAVQGRPDDSGSEPSSQDAGFPQPRMRESRRQGSGKAAGMNGALPHTNTETTSEITTDTYSNIRKVNASNSTEKRPPRVRDNKPLPKRSADPTAAPTPAALNGFQTLGQAVAARYGHSAPSAGPARDTARLNPPGPSRPALDAATEEGSADDDNFSTAGLSAQEVGMISELTEQMRMEMQDAASFGQSVNRMKNLYLKANCGPAQFVERFDQARAETKLYTAKIKKRAQPDGNGFRRKVAAPYFFSVLEDKLGLKPAQRGAERR